MATKYSTAATKATQDPPARFEASEFKGNVFCAYDEYDLASDGAVLALADVVKFQKLPAGARIVEVAMSFPDLGTGGHGTFGWEANADEVADADGIFTDIDFETADDTVLMSSGANVPGFGKKFTAETQLSLTITEATTAAVGVIKCAVTYVMD